MQAELSAMPEPAAQNTEVLRMVRQRVGQQAYRQAMLDYWGGACAVTGLALPQALRASHAKPWAECASDAERLDVFNGLLLSPTLDALFDGGWITFSAAGSILISTALSSTALAVLGFPTDGQIRGLQSRHQQYLEFHRQQVFRAASGARS